ncbi:hypothetical protein L1S35_10690 [Flavobacterium sp. AS60]|uniref:hypothetical protein n=1 Tax=Flavobacterium anseongense TaxID=2910677 RepID=UPI001F2216F3|nr:hypothetical protein [Flavobacterium sp. AS60]MCF6130144.1 hypothetical protein [Flavobacterium sp. AS60]
MNKNKLFVLGLLAFSNIIFSQENAKSVNYPQVKGFFGVLHPIVTVNKEETVYNFSDYYTVGFPTGINVIKNEHFGYSLEVVPFIKAEDGKDKVTNVLFHPGLLFRYKHGFTFIPRLAFETGGRYGFTAILNKVIVKSKDVSYFIATPLPVRFGNEHPPSIGFGLQFGATF